jgi:hypothetical protein
MRLPLLVLSRNQMNNFSKRTLVGCIDQPVEALRGKNLALNHDLTLDMERILIESTMN